MKATDKKRELIQAIVIFVVLVIVGIGLAVGAASAVESAFDSTVLISVGSAIFGGALAFFLVEMFRQNSAR